MRKKLDTRFPAARIKKIMQADEEIGKIAMAVPLLVSKALELFLQDLCDRAYEITVQSGAKTLNSLHLKQCVQSFNVFDFLREVVVKVPDLGGSDAAGEDKFVTKRRKVIGDGNHDSDDESKRGRLQEMVHLSGSGSGRGRGNRCRGRGRPRTRGLNEATTMAIDVDSKENRPVRNFDLNLGLDENGNAPLPISAAEWLTMATPPAKQIVEMKAEEYPGWLLEDMAIDPVKVANLNGRVDEEQEDYDGEEE